MTYNRYYPKLKFELKPKAERQNLKQEITAGVLYIEEIYNGTGTPFINAYNTYGELGYYLEKRIINQHISARANFTLHEDFTQGRYELKHRLFYNKQRKTFTTRLFVGHFFNNNSNSPIFNLRMDGQTGFYDYQKNQIFPDRAGNIDVWKNQMNENHGAFKSPTSVGQSSKWMGAVNMKLEAPIKLPLGLYSDIGVAEATDFMYNGGIYVSIIRDICEVYFPVAWSENIKTAYEANGTEYGEKIRFTLNLPLANPYSLIQSIQF
jgi:hypothetical protein